MRKENVAAFEKIVFFGSKCYNRNIPNTKGRKLPCQDRHGAVEFVERQEHTLRLLPVYLQPASAGTGQWLDDDAQEMTEVDESVPTKAEFGVRIAGDSMEPRFVNGQTVWVKAAQYANNGDIVLCTLNDQGYCKKLRKDKNGIALISLNKKCAPIPVQEKDEFRIAGIVVG